MVKKLIRGYYWNFLGNYGTKAQAQKSAKGHKKEWGGRTTITVSKIGVPSRSRYLLWHRGGKG